MINSSLPAPTISRRGLLGLSAAAGLGLTTVGGSAFADTRPTVAPAVPDDVYGVGIASGDPHPDGMVLWTRLAPEPTATDGLAGMPDVDVDVEWEVATDPGMTTVVQRGTERATSAWNHSVHAEVAGLQPGREYWYRFRTAGQISEVGRAVTAPALGSTPAAMTFAFTSCQNFPEGWFNAYADMATQDLDLVLHLGDYIYEGAGTNNALGRAHTSRKETFTLADYRLRYGQYKTDTDLQAAHAAAPWVVSPDDHEVENNWAGDISQPDTEPDQDPAVFRQRRAAAFQAYYENLPLRRASMPKGADMQVYRRLRFGQLLQLDVLDTRRHRSDQIEGDQAVLDGRWDRRRTMLGRTQEAWLMKGLDASEARWKVLGNQVFCFEADHTDGPGERYGNDTWGGYAAARQRMFDGILQRGVENFVMVTGDAHRSTAADLKQDFSDPSSTTVGAEFLGTSISSGGNGTDTDALGRTWLAENPHMRFHNGQRGYQVVRADAQQLETEYRICDSVTVKGSALRTRAKLVVESGRAGIADVSVA
ncbi:alkaline phosphatase D family protein [Auraticoccus monumenti]|uniref:Alkaline phosphatase D n=1 Tax=Auraticoccus monumenti TaxID=675864 RepID=A0A1G6T4N8_9ACTN|nr:alkaline phosphatase D family protein [Auraticoccus monumenti]SDD23506.1 alkaline phosphatase D [Auraticoccus monumenti]